MKILIVNDSERITEMLSKYLEAKGQDCVGCNDGRNGLALIMKNKFDAMLLDMTMPEFSGIDVIDYLAAAKKLKENKIILFTDSSISDEQIDELVKKGIHGYIREPVNLDLLLITLCG